jgi:predicted RNA-binding Zn-ribbon protein involved in translation (DUF1610 family)
MKLFENTREVLRTLKHKRPTLIYCPRCGNPDIKLSTGLDIWLTPKKYVCTKCGYVGPIVMELEEEKKEEDA